MAGANVLLSEAIEPYLRKRERGARNTHLQDRDILRRFLRVTGDLQLRHLTPAHGELYFYGGRVGRQDWPGIAEMVGTVTFNHYRSRLRSFFAYCRASGWLRLDPLVNVERARSVPQEKTWLTPDQLVQMLEATEDPRDRAFLALAMNTGLRASEVASLRVGHLNLPAGTLSVEITKTSDRDVMPVTADLDREMRVWLTAYTERVGRLEPDMHLFPAREAPKFDWEVDEATGERVRFHREMRLRPHARIGHPAGIVKAAGERLGLVMWGQGVHLLRRSMARLYFQMRRDEGYDGALRETSALLHHTRSSTTELYLGLDPERERRDASLRGRPFLTALAAADNVTPLRRAEGAR